MIRDSGVIAAEGNRLMIWSWAERKRRTGIVNLSGRGMLLVSGAAARVGELLCSPMCCPAPAERTGKGGLGPLS
jgi:hypothetical protein